MAGIGVRYRVIRNSEFVSVFSVFLMFACAMTSRAFHVRIAFHSFDEVTHQVAPLWRVVDFNDDGEAGEEGERV